jgi:hypothetical protein
LNCIVSTSSNICLGFFNLMIIVYPLTKLKINHNQKSPNDTKFQLANLSKKYVWTTFKLQINERTNTKCMINVPKFGKTISELKSKTRTKCYPGSVRNVWHLALYRVFIVQEFPKSNEENTIFVSRFYTKLYSIKRV